MSRIKSLVFVVVSAIFQTAPSLTAQQQVFDAKVPFQFSAGDRAMPAGEYRITGRNSFLSLGNRSDNSFVQILGYGTHSSGDGEVHLVFDHVNDAFFLREILTPGGSIQLAVSRSEKKAIHQRRLLTANPPVVTTSTVTTGGQ